MNRAMTSDITDIALPTIVCEDDPTPDEFHDALAKAQRLGPIAVGAYGPEVLGYDRVRSVLRDSRFVMLIDAPPRLGRQPSSGLSVDDSAACGRPLAWLRSYRGSFLAFCVSTTFRCFERMRQSSTPWWTDGELRCLLGVWRWTPSRCGVAASRSARPPPVSPPALVAVYLATKLVRRVRVRQ
jgi:hypothetical protein